MEGSNVPRLGTGGQNGRGEWILTPIKETQSVPEKLTISR